MKEKWKVSEDEFAASRVLSKASDPQIAVCRSVMIDGLSFQEAGELHGVSRQAAYKSATGFLVVVKNYREALLRAQVEIDKRLPEGWTSARVIGPENLIKEFQKNANELLDSLFNEPL